MPILNAVATMIDRFAVPVTRIPQVVTTTADFEDVISDGTPTSILAAVVRRAVIVIDLVLARNFLCRLCRVVFCRQRTDELFIEPHIQQVGSG